MEQKAFDSVIQFAVEREKEAVRFYQDLQGRVRFTDRKDFLKSLEKMEEGHVKVLEHLQNQDVDDMDIPSVPELEISDYLVEVEITDSMSYQDILIVGMKREEAAYDLYTKLAGQTPGNQIKKVFQKLASEEAKHKLYFEKLYDEDILQEN